MSEAGQCPASRLSEPASPPRVRDLPAVLRPVERDVGAVEEVGAGVLRRQLGDARRRADGPTFSIGFAAIARDDPTGEELGVGAGRLGEDHRELVAAEAARDVGGADEREDAPADLGEHRVAGEMAWRCR